MDPDLVNAAESQEMESLRQRVADLVVERGRLLNEVHRLKSLLTASELKVRLLSEGIDVDS
ncbi:hypothetical protein FHX74_001640 [Friedmanniella endophytica]|uniref:Transposase n=1 Tax=Microlunatus kandeliicorticis TaxID=1759536 RepID=A0A7W3IRW4_9ACTN|nr:hypothetical protein [Microlunatus kandeliicorticis]